MCVDILKLMTRMNKNVCWSEKKMPRFYFILILRLQN